MENLSWAARAKIARLIGLRGAVRSTGIDVNYRGGRPLAAEYSDEESIFGRVTQLSFLLRDDPGRAAGCS